MMIDDTWLKSAKIINIIIDRHIEKSFKILKKSSIFFLIMEKNQNYQI